MSMPFGLLEPDVLLPHQWKVRSGISSEELLMVAVLGNALASFQKHASATDANGRRQFAEDREWIYSSDRQWPFSFENVCDVLQIDAEWVRWKLRHWRQRHARRTRHGRPLTPSPPTTLHARRRHPTDAVQWFPRGARS
jgi:hypothetical protein